ncbi:hypothetical protein CKF54_01520 [Psittacicella hinzii]|uniref:Regulator of ribonuclease activity B domain-containing protein n=1 Tax=Psittacicella hinzii TaxID=2028575 RepID=A0A3A1YDB9_9GAMM|nr:ribonuclease E inhibitor RraB [Psittacicella hinzii]RIY34137.1 hypothetical protein CKF54_01520 [Psittacicella hinzii]
MQSNHSYSKKELEKVVNATFADLEANGSLKHLDHIFLHHILFRSEDCIEEFISKANKLNFEFDDPEFFDREMLEDEDLEKYPEGFWNLDLITESTLEEPDVLLADIEEILSLIEQFPSSEVSYGLFGTFVEDGEDEEDSDIEWASQD